MTTSPRLSIVPVGLSLSTFFVATYLLCILLGLLFSGHGIQQLYPMLLPGFTWLTWPSFVLGLVWVFVYGWYIAIVFVPIYNFFAARDAK